MRATGAVGPTLEPGKVVADVAKGPTLRSYGLTVETGLTAGADCVGGTLRTGHVPGPAL